MIYTDGYHLWSDKSKEELLKFGEKLKIKPELLRSKGCLHAFDLKVKGVSVWSGANATRFGAKAISEKTLIEKMRQYKAENEKRVNLSEEQVSSSRCDWTIKQVQKLSEMSKKLSK